MKKLKFKIAGTSFQPDDIKNTSPCAWNIPKYVQWIHRDNPEKEDVFFWSDNNLRIGLQTSELKYGWIFESPQYVQEHINHILYNLDEYKRHYKYIFTQQIDLVEMGPPFAFVISQLAPRIQHAKDKQIYQKTKLVSALISTNNVNSGHRRRLQWLSENEKYVDVFGRGRENQTEFSWQSKVDYMFAVEFENIQNDIFVNNQLTNAMACGAVPIYWGSKYGVEQYFDSKGVLWVDEIDVSKDLSPELYYRMMPHIKNNFEIACSMPTQEDYLVENFFKDLSDSIQ